MRTPKFKVGDKVRVFRASTTDEHKLWGDGWCSPEMDEYIGKVSIIDHVYYDEWQEEYEYCKYSLEESGYAFPEFVLGNLIVKGEQMVFDFMR